MLRGKKKTHWESLWRKIALRRKITWELEKEDYGVSKARLGRNRKKNAYMEEKKGELRGGGCITFGNENGKYENRTMRGTNRWRFKVKKKSSTSRGKGLL